MALDCENKTMMPIHCADAFGEIRGDLRESRAEMMEALKRIEKQTTKTNGSVTDLYNRTEANAKDIVRLQDCDAHTATDTKRRSKWIERIWALGVAVVLVIITAAVTMVCGG